MEIFCHFKIILAIFSFPLAKINYFYTLNTYIIYFLTTIIIINLAIRWQENVEQTLTEKKIASVASLNQLVQHEKKKSWPTRSQKDRECLIQHDLYTIRPRNKYINFNW
jgi:hypothetical protein